MPRSHARVKLSIWHDPDFLALPGGAQRLYMTLLSQDTLTYCGVTTWTLRRLSRLAADSTPKSITKELAELERATYVVVDHETEELWIRSFLKHDGVLLSPNLVTAMVNAFDTVHSDSIRQAILAWVRKEYPQGFGTYLRNQFPDGFRKGFPEGFVELLAEGSYTHADAGTPGPARTPSPGPSPSPDPSPVPRADEGTDGLLRSKLGTRTDLNLAERLVAACSGAPTVIAPEASAVVAWSLQHVDRKLVEESIGWAESKRCGPEPVRFPRAVAGIIESKAADHGNTIPSFRPVA